MTRQANILSFDEVKSREASSPRTVSPSRSSRRLRQAQLAEEQRSAQRQSRTEGRSSAQRHARNAQAQEPGTLDKLRKRFRTAKADRQFDRTVGAKERSQTTQEQGSRAAVYNMSMGSTHRRSARMAEENAGRKAPSFQFPFSLPFAGNLSAHATTILVGAFALVLGVALLYPSVANYYNETRQLQQLEAEYAALQEYNTQKQAEVNYLNTDEGVEDYARSELGWVASDEKVVQVEGVQPTTTSESSSTERLVQEGSVKAPDTWYSGVLDVIFGYAG